MYTNDIIFLKTFRNFSNIIDKKRHHALTHHDQMANLLIFIKKILLLTLNLLNFLNGLVCLIFLSILSYVDIKMKASLVRLYGYVGWSGSILVAKALSVSAG